MVPTCPRDRTTMAEASSAVGSREKSEDRPRSTELERVVGRPGRGTADRRAWCNPADAWCNPAEAHLQEGEELLDLVEAGVPEDAQPGMVSLPELVVLPDLNVHSRPPGPASVPSLQVEVHPQIVGLQRPGLGAARAGASSDGPEQAVTPHVQEDAAEAAPSGGSVACSVVWYR